MTINIPNCNIRKWNKLTKYCYDIDMDCEKCDYFPDEFKANCKVKYHVVLLYDKFGEPKAEDE